MKLAYDFVDFADKIRNLSATGPAESELNAFLLEDTDGIRMYYAPFDWINTAARIVIVGITPGKDSMLNAFRAARSALREGKSTEEACRRAKRKGSFFNMRFTIGPMLDELGLPDVLGISKSEELFAARCDLLHPTSCVRYPVLVWSDKKQQWLNYTGYKPKLLKWGMAVHYIECVLAAELRKIPGALMVPCGEAVTAALRHLAAKNIIDPRSCLFGFPHASGANGHRKRYFDERRDQLRRTVDEWGRSGRSLTTSPRG